MWGYAMEFWESVFFWSTGIAAVAGGIGVTAAFIAGIVGYQVTDRVAKESDRKISEANAVAADANERAQLLEKETTQAKLELERLKIAQQPRQLNTEAFRAVLKDNPSRDIEILYQPGDNEAQNLAMQIFTGLVGSTWAPSNPLKSFPHPIPSTATRAGLRELPKKLFDAIPPIERITTSLFGISIISKKSSDVLTTPQRVLVEAFRAGGFGVPLNDNSELPDNLLVIVVGPKP